MGKAKQDNQDVTSDKPKKGFFQKLGSLCYETDPSALEEESTTNQSTSNSAPNKFAYSDVSQGATTNSPASVGMCISNPNGMFDEKFYNNFLQVIEANNIDGMDYFEFSKVLKSLSNTGMADPLKYQAAFSSLQATSNLTKQKLIETADFYLDKLDQEEKSFSSEMKNEIDSEV